MVKGPLYQKRKSSTCICPFITGPTNPKKECLGQSMYEPDGNYLPGNPRTPIKAIKSWTIPHPKIVTISSINAQSAWG